MPHTAQEPFMKTCRCNHIRTIPLTMFCLLFGAAAPPARAADAGIRWTAVGHRTSVDGVAFSPDGRLAASAGEDHTLKLWRTADGSPVRTIVHPNNFDLHSVEFASDGLSIVASGAGGAYQWRVSDGELIQTFCCLETGYDTAFYDGGQKLAVGGSIDGLAADVRLFRISDGALLQTFTGADLRYVLSVLVTAGGKLIAAEGSPSAGQGTGAIRIWDIASGVEEHVLTEHTGRVTSLALAPDGQTFASGSDDQTIKLWDVASATSIDTLTGHTGFVFDVTFSPDGLNLASASADATVRTWDLGTGQATQVLTDFVDDVAGVRYSPDGETLIGCGGRIFANVADPAVRVWSAGDGQLLNTFTQFGTSLESVAISGDGATLAAAGAYDVNGYVELRAVADGTQLMTIDEPAWVYEVAFSPDSTLLASAGSDKVIRVRDATTGGLLHSLTGHTGTIQALAFSPDSAVLASTAYGEPIRLWNPATGGLIRTLTAASPGAIALGFSADGQYLAGAQDQEARLWRVADGGIEQTYSGIDLSSSVAVSPTGNVLAVGYHDGNIKIFNLATGADLRTLPVQFGHVSAIAFSSDGEVLAASYNLDEPAVRFWRVADGALLETIQEETATGVPTLVLSPDDRLFAFIRRDNALVVARNPVGPLPGDIDDDGLIGQADYLAFTDCIAGPGAAPTPAQPLSAQQCYNVFDSDADADVDLADFAEFAAVFSGP